MKRIWCWMVILTMLGILSIPICAEKYVPPAIAYNEKSKQEYLSNSNLQFISEETQIEPNPLINFAVSADGTYALGSRAFTRCAIGVYDANDNFLYGYTFLSEGAFCLDWIEGYVTICFVRGSVLMSLDSVGNCVRLAKTTEEADTLQYWWNLDYNEITHGTTTYRLQNPKAWWSIKNTDADFKQFVRIDAQGNEVILHEVEEGISASQISGIFRIGALAFTIIIVAQVVVIIRKLSEER